MPLRAARAPVPVTEHDTIGVERRRLAGRIRAERLARGWTLRDLGSRIGASIAHLSAIENARQPLGVDLLVAIGRAFAMPLDRLVPNGGAPAFCVSRQDGGGHLPMRLVNCTNERLSDYHNKLRPLAGSVVGKFIEPFDIEVWPVSDAEMKFISHHHEEFLLVMDGALECLIRTPDALRREVLSAGDCIHFWSYLPHCLRSTGTAPARSIHVLCSLDEPADSELEDARTGPVFMVDGAHRGLSAGIGERLQALRRRRGMGVAEFARQAGTTARRMVALEHGHKPASVDLLLDICHRFGKPLEYFLATTLDVPPYCEIHRGSELQQMHPRERGVRRLWPCAGAARARALTTTLSGHRMTPALLRLDPGARRPLARHPGQEFVYVLKGSVRVFTRTGEREEVTLLSTGESCFLGGSIPHAFEQTQVTPYQSGHADVLAVSWRPPWA